MTERKIRGSKNADKQVWVSERTRQRLREHKDDGGTYSDVVKDIVPEDAEEFSDPGEFVTVPVDDEAHARLAELAGEGVPFRAIVEYYMLRELITADMSPYDVLDEVYNREEAL